MVNRENFYNIRVKLGGGQGTKSTTAAEYLVSLPGEVGKSSHPRISNAGYFNRLLHMW